jgi:hypothetical protein
MQLIQGCIITLSTAQQALQMIMRQAPPLSWGLEQQRLVFAPWLALTGRCLLAQAHLLSMLKAMLLPADLSPLLRCFHALYDCLDRVESVLQCWRSGSCSSSGILWDDSPAFYDFSPDVLVLSLLNLQRQLDADKAFAAGGGCAAVQQLQKQLPRPPGTAQLMVTCKACVGRTCRST